MSGQKSNYSKLQYFKNDKSLPTDFKGKFIDKIFPPNKYSLQALKPNGKPIYPYARKDPKDTSK